MPRHKIGSGFGFGLAQGFPHQDFTEFMTPDPDAFNKAGEEVAKPTSSIDKSSALIKLLLPDLTLKFQDVGTSDLLNMAFNAQKKNPKNPQTIREYATENLDWIKKKGIKDEAVLRDILLRDIGHSILFTRSQEQ